MPEPRLALQLYVFAKSGLPTPEVLAQAKAAGYCAVEGGVGAAFAQQCVDAGMIYAGAHTALNSFPTYEACLGTKAVSGVIDIVSSGVLRWGDLQAEDYRRAVPLLNEHGRRLRDLGLRLSYHNHEFEFAQLSEGSTGMDILLDGLDPGAVELCADLGWVHLGGVDPVAFVRAHGQRLGVVHLRDHDGADWVPLGRGKLDLRGIAAELAKLPNVRRIVVEQDPHAQPAEQARISREWLASTLGW